MNDGKPRNKGPNSRKPSAIPLSKLHHQRRMAHFQHDQLVDDQTGFDSYEIRLHNGLRFPPPQSKAAKSKCTQRKRLNAHQAKQDGYYF